jgi:hypothetical protein
VRKSSNYIAVSIVQRALQYRYCSQPLVSLILNYTTLYCTILYKFVSSSMLLSLALFFFYPFPSSTPACAFLYLPLSPSPPHSHPFQPSPPLPPPCRQLSTSTFNPLQHSTRARICKPFNEPRNRFPTWRAGMTNRTGPPGYIGWRNRFIGINTQAP